MTYDIFPRALCLKGNYSKKENVFLTLHLQSYKYDQDTYISTTDQTHPTKVRPQPNTGSAFEICSGSAKADQELIPSKLKANAEHTQSRHREQTQITEADLESRRCIWSN